MPNRTASLVLLMPLTLPLGTVSAAEPLSACFGPTNTVGVTNGDAGPITLISAKEALLGRTLTVEFFAAPFDAGLRAEAPIDPEPLVRKFTATAVTESSGAQQVTYDITYEADHWCRINADSGRKECFGVGVGHPSFGPYKLLEVEVPARASGICNFYVIGKIDDLPLAAPVPRPEGGRRRGG